MDERKPERSDDVVEPLPIDLDGDAIPPGLSVIETLGGAASRVLLRDPPFDTPSPVVTSRSPASVEGRYHVLGEIARGGIGIVMKGRDVDLGRDVAMKVLRDEHAGDPRIVQRFVEEAQIGGQLQHPGIVPVYELGLRADKRPFFTMKLVKGRTLAALLVDRTDAAQDRRRFLAMFEQICQTVAYAHARGVIHRDLKPSNVMVGAFGEVQVVDWGLAKVLGQGGVDDERRAQRASVDAVATVRTTSVGSESVAGSIMGTPGYMSPEQALGDLDALDERSDVFSLGGVLCEILTGKPAYTGDGIDVVRRSALGDVADARARLAVCGADAEIVALAERCLAPSPENRPRDAGVVASAVAAYLASVEERARLAEIAVVEARARAAEERASATEARADADRQRERAEQERRTRRLTAALAATVVLVAAAVGSAWLEIERDRATRSAETSREIDDALAQAAFLRHRATDRADVEAGTQAVESARHADALATSRGADEKTRARTARAVVDGEADAAAARDAAARVRRARTSLENGDFKDAAATLREVTAAAPGCAEAHAALAAALAGLSDLTGAVAEHREAIRLRPDDVDYRTNLARLVARWALDPADSLAQFREIARLDPESAAARSQLAAALMESGDLEGAAAEAREVSRLSPDLGKRLAQRLERRTKSVALIPDFVAGKAEPTDELADALRSKRMFASEARCRERLIATKPADPKPVDARPARTGLANFMSRYSRSLYDVAVAAALAGTGESVDADALDDAERRRLRSAALARIQELLADETPRRPDSTGAPYLVSLLRTTWALRGVRDAERVAQLPADEQEAWRQLWTSVDATIAKLGPTRDWRGR